MEYNERSKECKECKEMRVGGASMDTARLSSKGQVTIPISIRRRLGLRAGENVVFVENGNSVVITSEVGVEISPNAFSKISETVNESFATPDGFQTKDKRRKVLRSLYGSVDDSVSLISHEHDVEYKSPRDWGLMDE